MAKLSLRNVQKHYANLQVVHGIDMEIGDGEFIVIVGPSGCGKSTLLRMVAGLEPITGGEVWIGDRVVNELEPAERDIAMVFQNYALYPHMSVFDNMAYGLKIRGLPKSDIQARVEQAAGILELGKLLDRKPRQLSGGQRQRVAMGRAIVREPAVFLFDEPLSNLDAKLRVQMRLELKDLHRRLRTTSLYVTHDQVEAMSMCDRIAIMQHGKVIQFDTPVGMYTNPSSAFVAEFLGNPPIAFLDGTLDAQGFASPGAQIPLALRAAHPSAGRAVRIGLRPEHVEVTTEGENVANVSFIEHQGREILYDLQLKSGAIVRTLQPAKVELQLGESVHWYVAPKNVLAFDERGGRLHVA